MKVRSLSILVVGAVVTSVFSAAPAGAQDAPPPEIPEVVNIDDPLNDANYLNDQSLLVAVPPSQDNDTPADVGGTSDLLKIWYSHTAETISVHIQLQLMPPATAASYIYRVYSNPGEGTVTSSTLGCLRFFVFMPSGAPPAGGYSGDQYAGLLDYCDGGTDYTSAAIPGELVLSAGPDDTGIMTVTVPRSASPKLADDQVLVTPQAQVQHLHGTGTDGNGQPTATDGNWRRGAQIDNTILGTDYTITPVGDEPPPDEPPGCKKGKGKKKGCKKRAARETSATLTSGRVLPL